MKLNLEYLEEVCRNIRKDIFLSINNAKAGHLSGSFSAVEILVTLYFGIMNIDPLKPKFDKRDRFINSKGHATAVYYSTLANRGYFDREDFVKSFICAFSNFEEHGNSSVPGVDISTGSLGQGLSIGAGMALSSKMLKKAFNTYVLMGDGELQEGQIWEAAMFAAHYKLDNLIGIIDNNSFQVSGKIEKVLSIEPLIEKWKSFNWEVYEVDGHSLKDLIICFKNIKKNSIPKIIIANTVKGKGISFMEKEPTEYHSYVDFSNSELEIIEKELKIKCT